MKKTTTFLFVLFSCYNALSQQVIPAQDSEVKEKTFKNTIHFNVTNPLIFGTRSIIFGYERVINKHQSFTINMGSADFPSLRVRNDDSLRVKPGSEQKGFNISGDYRFYLAKENRYSAPRGVYIGPYYSYNYFNRKNNWELRNESGNLTEVGSDLTMNIHTVGVELGYQFIFWNRLSVDMVLIGPGVSSYNLKASLGNNLSDEDREKLFQKLNDALTEKFPGYSWAIDADEFESSGRTNTTSLGFRYMVQVGFRF